jgi:glycosyltransferase involved in cell wall biosynthesis
MKTGNTALKNKKTDNKIAILIPAYNEERYIESVINNCLIYNLDIIIVDDGSDDATLKIVMSIPKPENTNIIIISHLVNKGKGQALKTGFEYVLRNNYSGVITLDADGQHDTGEINKFLKTLKKEKPDLIIGNRLGDTKEMPFIRLATNVFTSWIISNIAGKKVRDVQCGFRYISSRALKNISLETKNFDTEPEIILKAGWLDYKIKNLPIKTIYHKDFISYVNPVKDTIKFFRLVFNSLKWKQRFSK